jgi:hypothetical protein
MRYKKEQRFFLVAGGGMPHSRFIKSFVGLLLVFGCFSGSSVFCMGCVRVCLKTSLAKYLYHF